MLNRMLTLRPAHAGLRRHCLELVLACGLIGAAGADEPVLISQFGSGSGTSLKDVVTEKSDADQFGLPLEGGDATSKYLLHPEYSKQMGASVTGAYGTMLGKDAAIGGIVTVGARAKEGIVNLGFKIDRHQFVFTLNHLRQSLEYDFLSGAERVDMTQNSAAGSYKYKLGNDSRNFLELNAYGSRTDSRNLDDATMVFDNGEFFEVANLQRRVAGGKVDGIQAKVAFAPLPGSALAASLGRERLRYDLAGGESSDTRWTKGIEWNQQLFNGYSFTARANEFASQRRYGLGVEKCVADGQQIGFDLIRIRGRDGMPDDNQARLTWAVKLGGRPSCAPRTPSPDPGDSAPTWRGRGLLDQVVLRPDFLPAQIVAKPDDTLRPQRAVGIDRTGLPAGTTIGADGTLDVPLNACVSGVTNVTRNGTAFTNAGQFSVAPSCTRLIIDTGRLPRPTAGLIDTYVVTTGDSQGCSVLTTLTVAPSAVTVTGVNNANCDTTPNAFSFAAQRDVPLNTLVESNAITVTGINAPAPVSIVGGELQIDGGAWTRSTASPNGMSVKAALTVVNGQSVRVRQTSASTHSTSVTTTLTIGGVSGAFTSTTVSAAANAAPTITNLPSLPNGVPRGTSVGLSVTFGDDKPFAGPSAVSVSASAGTISGFSGGSYGNKSFTYTAPPATVTSAAPPVTEILTFSVTDSDGVTTTASINFVAF